jgi:hypothetical protein
MMGRLVRDDVELEGDMAKNVSWDEDASLGRGGVEGATGQRCDPAMFAQTLRDIGQRFVADIDGGACPKGLSPPGATCS